MKVKSGFIGSLVMATLTFSSPAYSGDLNISEGCEGKATEIAIATDLYGPAGFGPKWFRKLIKPITTSWPILDEKIPYKSEEGVENLYVVSGFINNSPYDSLGHEDRISLGIRLPGYGSYTPFSDQVVLDACDGSLLKILAGQDDNRNSILLDVNKPVSSEEKNYFNFLTDTIYSGLVSKDFIPK